MLEVVSAVIIRTGRILLTQRRQEKDFPFMWESPGGKVEANEANYEALARELREEIGVRAWKIDTKPIWGGEFKNMVVRLDRTHVHVQLYGVHLVEGETPKPLEGQGLGWFTVVEMMNLHLAPANACARMAIRRLMT